ncbi:RPA-interacting protein-like [Osmia bicornis bicornis]|uniref:RPA-interacting protein-like n=1 Tax=Osmia bicornis bicornis TaxID=1437191 RepID=UPI0010F6D965|nr:RPA-interacting protein-like [Osmia bicornis bicornis]
MFKCTKDMENITLSPTMTAKLKSKNAAKKIKEGSPKFQEVFRERCRQRMREKRRQLFNNGRFGLETSLEEVQDTLSEIVRKELNDLVTTDLDPTLNPFSPITSEPLNTEEAMELETEILNEEEQWILEEYEKMSQEEMESLALIADTEGEVICPICQTSNLIQKENHITCTSCDFTLNGSITLKDLGYVIKKTANTHSEICREPPGFLSVPENNTCLYLVCNKCSTWLSIV